MTVKQRLTLPTKRAVNFAIGKRPLLLDLFSGAGGAAMGYYRAGFDVIGIDMAPQPRYPFTFIQSDWREALDQLFSWGLVDDDGTRYLPQDFAAAHASPPCQGYSLMQNYGAPAQPRLIPPVRESLEAWGIPWIIENVEGARSDMRGPVLVCGASFGLGAAGLDLNRHRLFESSIMLMVPECQHRRGQTIGVYGHGTNSWHRKKMGRNITMKERREAMGIDWMRRGEDSEAIPPAYTEYLGKQLLNSIAVGVIERAALRVLREQAS